jgi:hypothetical protein
MVAPVSAKTLVTARGRDSVIVVPVSVGCARAASRTIESVIVAPVSLAVTEKTVAAGARRD